MLLPQTSDPEPANQLPGPYTYASHPPMQGNGGTSALPGGDPSRFAAWLLGLEANEDPTGLIGLGQAIVRVFLYVACVLDGECRASLTELQALTDELGSAEQVTMRWTGKLLSRAATMWPLLPMAHRGIQRMSVNLSVNSMQPSAATLSKHGDIQSGVLGRAEGADLAYLQKQTILISHGGSAIMENGLVFFTDEWRAIIEGLMSQPNLK